MSTKKEGHYVTTKQKFELKTSTKTKVIQVFILRSKPYKIELYIKIAEFFVYETLLPFCPTKTRWRRELGKRLFILTLCAQVAFAALLWVTTNKK